MSLSIVIPTLNEEKNIQRSVDSILVYEPTLPTPEIIVVDGGSRDGTIDKVKQLGCKVIISRPGRGPQQNAGWEQAGGDWVLFLHGDSCLPPSYGKLMAQALSGQHNKVWGCFESIDVQDLDIFHRNLLKWSVYLRTRYFRTPYGDQGLFVRKSVLQSTKGFRDWPMMEDVEYVKRLNQISEPCIIPVPMQTSGRRWCKLGFWRTTAINQLILFAWKLGVPVDTLAAWYRGNPKPSSKP